MNQVNSKNNDLQTLNQAEKVDQILTDAFNSDNLEEITDNIVKINELIEPKLNIEADNE